MAGAPEVLRVHSQQVRIGGMWSNQGRLDRCGGDLKEVAASLMADRA